MPKSSYSFKGDGMLTMAYDNKTPQPVASVKVELKHFTGKENFTLWQMRMKYILNEHVLSVVLAGKEKSRKP